MCAQVHNLTIRAKGKILLENTQLTITAGRRYGLIGPNGKGKSTLLRMIARRQVPVPETLDILLVEQVCVRVAPNPYISPWEGAACQASVALLEREGGEGEGERGGSACV